MLLQHWFFVGLLFQLDVFQFGFGTCFQLLVINLAAVAKLDVFQIPKLRQAPTVGGNVPPQQVGLYTIIDLYLLISTGSALQNVKELHGIFILVKRVAHLHFAPTHQQTSTPALSLQ